VCRRGRRRRAGSSIASPGGRQSHLVLAAILAGLHLGISIRPIPVCPHGQRRGEADPNMRFDLASALDRLSGSELLARYFDPAYLKAYVAVKDQRARRFSITSPGASTTGICEPRPRATHLV